MYICMLVCSYTHKPERPGLGRTGEKRGKEKRGRRKERGREGDGEIDMQREKIKGRGFIQSHRVGDLGSVLKEAKGQIFI